MDRSTTFGDETDASVGSTLRNLPVATALLVVAYIALMIAPLVFGNGSIELYLSPFALIGLLPATIAMGWHLYRPSARSFLAAGVTILLLPILVVVSFGIGPLADPAVFSSFAGSALMVLVIALALPATISGFRTMRADRELTTMADAGTSRMAAFAFFAAALMIGAVLTSSAASMQAREAAAEGAGYDFEPSQTIEVTTEGFAFHPAAVTIPAGEIVEISVTNTDPELHTFTYEKDGTVYNHDVPPGSTVKFLVFFEEATTLSLWCEPHKDDMVGEIVAE